MARTTIPDAVLYEDVIIALGGNYKAKEKLNLDIFKDEYKAAPAEEENKKNFNLKKIISGSIPFAFYNNNHPLFKNLRFYGY